MKRTAFVSALLLALLLATALHATVRRVPSDYPTIQAALDVSVDGDEVAIEPGTYHESLVVPGRAITLRSDGGNPTNTILDGSTLAEGVTLITVEGDATGTRALRDLTIRGAEQGLFMSGLITMGHLVIEGCRFLDNGPFPPVRAFGPSLDVIDSEFIDNEGYAFGGAVAMSGGGQITGNLFRDNDAIPFFGPFTQGGAIYLFGINATAGSTVNIEDNTFEGNTCTDYGGAIYIDHLHNVSVRGNRFDGNDAIICAGSIYVAFNRLYSVVIENNVFENDRSAQGASIGVDGCSGVTVRSNTIVGARAGEGIRVEASNNVIIEQNIVAFGTGGGLRWVNSGGASRCNDIFANAGGDFVNGPTSATNISLDPVFCSMSSGDYSLAAGSPCLPNISGCGMLIGALPFGCGALPVEEMTWGGVKQLFREQ